MRAVLERHREEGEALIAKEAVTPETIRTIHSADMQFVGQTHILNVRAAVARRRPRDELQALFEKAYFARFRVELPEIRANLVNLNTSVIGVRAGGRPVAADRSGGQGGDARRRAARDAAGLVRRRVAATRRSTLREKLPLDAVDRRARRSSSRWTPRRCSSPATGRVSDADGNIIIEVGADA